MTRTFATIGTIAALLTSTAAFAETTNVNGPAGEANKVQATTGMTEYTSTANETASPATDDRVSGVREETVFDDSNASAMGPKGESQTAAADAGTVVIVTGETLPGDIKAVPSTNGPKGEAMNTEQTDGQTEYDSTAAVPASPATDYRESGVREETVFPADGENPEGPKGS